LQVANTPLVLKNSSSEAGLELYNKYVAHKLKGISIPKIEWIEDFLTDRQYYSSKAKTVIFTRSDDMAKLIADRLGRIFGIDKVLLYIGGLSEHMQQELKQKFWNEAVVIVCTDAAKEGLNLQCADVEINVDLPWNPASLQQRIGRIKRTASQFANVRIINLLSVNSIDERVLQVIYERQNLFDLIVNGNVAPIKLTEDLMRQLA
jgi:SNF2 family DNA or RNA helicase